MKLELHFPLTEGEKDFVRHLLDTTASVEDNGGGDNAPTILATPQGSVAEPEVKDEADEPEAAPEPKAKKASKTRKSAAKIEAVPDPVEEDDEEDDLLGADEPVEDDDTDYIQLATDKAVELIEAKDKDTVREALKAVGIKRVGEVKDQTKAKELYEALIA